MVPFAKRGMTWDVGGQGQVQNVKTKSSIVGVFRVKFRRNYQGETLMSSLEERVWNTEEKPVLELYKSRHHQHTDSI